CGKAFFDRHLKGVDSAEYHAMVDKPVKYYIQPSGDTPAQRYVETDRQPRGEGWPLTLGPVGATATVHYDPVAGATTGRWFARGSVPGTFPPPWEYYLGVDGPSDQRAEEQTSFSFSTPPLQE